MYSRIGWNQAALSHAKSAQVALIQLYDKIDLVIDRADLDFALLLATHNIAVESAVLLDFDETCRACEQCMPLLGEDPSFVPAPAIFARPALIPILTSLLGAITAAEHALQPEGVSLPASIAPPDESALLARLARCRTAVERHLHWATERHGTTAAVAPAGTPAPADGCSPSARSASGRRSVTGASLRSSVGGNASPATRRGVRAPSPYEQPGCMRDQEKALWPIGPRTAPQNSRATLELPRPFARSTDGRGATAPLAAPALTAATRGARPGALAAPGLNRSAALRRGSSGELVTTPTITTAAPGNTVGRASRALSTSLDCAVQVALPGQLATPAGANASVQVSSAGVDADSGGAAAGAETSIASGGADAAPTSSPTQPPATNSGTPPVVPTLKLAPQTTTSSVEAETLTVPSARDRALLRALATAGAPTRDAARLRRRRYSVAAAGQVWTPPPPPAAARETRASTSRALATARDRLVAQEAPGAWPSTRSARVTLARAPTIGEAPSALPAFDLRDPDAWFPSAYFTPAVLRGSPAGRLPPALAAVRATPAASVSACASPASACTDDGSLDNEEAALLAWRYNMHKPLAGPTTRPLSATRHRSASPLPARTTPRRALSALRPSSAARARPFVLAVTPSPAHRRRRGPPTPAELELAPAVGTIPLLCMMVRPATTAAAPAGADSSFGEAGGSGGSGVGAGASLSDAAASAPLMPAMAPSVPMLVFTRTLTATNNASTGGASGSGTSAVSARSLTTSPSPAAAPLRPAPSVRGTPPQRPSWAAPPRPRRASTSPLPRDLAIRLLRGDVDGAHDESDTPMQQPPMRFTSTSLTEARARALLAVVAAGSEDVAMESFPHSPAHRPRSVERVLGASSSGSASPTATSRSRSRSAERRGAPRAAEYFYEKGAWYVHPVPRRESVPGANGEPPEDCERCSHNRQHRAAVTEMVTARAHAAEQARLLRLSQRAHEQRRAVERQRVAEANRREREWSRLTHLGLTAGTARMPPSANLTAAASRTGRAREVTASPTVTAGCRTPAATSPSTPATAPRRPAAHTSLITTPTRTARALPAYARRPAATASGALSASPAVKAPSASVRAVPQPQCSPATPSHPPAAGAPTSASRKVTAPPATTIVASTTTTPTAAPAATGNTFPAEAHAAPPPIPSPPLPVVAPSPSDASLPTVSPAPSLDSLLPATSHAPASSPAPSRLPPLRTPLPPTLPSVPSPAGGDAAFATSTSSLSPLAGSGTGDVGPVVPKLVRLSSEESYTSLASLLPPETPPPPAATTAVLPQVQEAAQQAAS